MRRRKKDSGSAVLVFLVIILGVIAKILTDKPLLHELIRIAVIVLLSVLSIWVTIKVYRWKQRSIVQKKLIAAGSAHPMQLSPTEYEEFCAALLRNQGWKTQVTSQSGDYGADVIATKGRVTMVVQCKQWSGSVGVKAVQEVHTALSYYRANKAIVVTTSYYTKAAKNLAAKVGVELLTHEDLVKKF